MSCFGGKRLCRETQAELDAQVCHSREARSTRVVTEKRSQFGVVGDLAEGPDKGSYLKKFVAAAPVAWLGGRMLVRVDQAASMSPGLAPNQLVYCKLSTEPKESASSHRAHQVHAPNKVARRHPAKHRKTVQHQSGT